MAGTPKYGFPGGLILLCAAIALCCGAARAADADPQAILTQLNNTLGQIDRGNRQQRVFMMLQTVLHQMRGPLGGRFMYEYASVDMTDKPTVLVTETVTAPASGQHQLLHPFTGPYSLIDIHVPETLPDGEGNDQVYLGGIWFWDVVDGKAGDHGSAIKEWIPPGRSKEIPIRGTGNAALIRIAVGAPDASVGKALVQVRAYQPEITDSIRNPYYYAIRQIQKALELALDPAMNSRVRQYVEEAMSEVAAMIPEDPPPSSLQPAPAPELSQKHFPITRDEMTRKLEYIRFLMSGDSTDRDRAIRELDYLLQQLK